METLTPRFDIFKKLYDRIAAKPEALVRLAAYRSRPNDCGTPYCVLGELVCMPEAQALGFEWKGHSPYCKEVHAHNGSPARIALGLTREEARDLFDIRSRHDLTEKTEVLLRIERLFASHNVPLHLPEPDRDEEAETPRDAREFTLELWNALPDNGQEWGRWETLL